MFPRYVSHLNFETEFVSTKYELQHLLGLCLTIRGVCISAYGSNSWQPCGKTALNSLVICTQHCVEVEVVALATKQDY
jgi:hypothetical protein